MRHISNWELIYKYMNFENSYETSKTKCIFGGVKQ